LDIRIFINETVFFSSESLVDIVFVDSYTLPETFEPWVPDVFFIFISEHFINDFDFIDSIVIVMDKKGFEILFIKVRKLEINRVSIFNSADKQFIIQRISRYFGDLFLLFALYEIIDNERHHSADHNSGQQNKQ